MKTLLAAKASQKINEHETIFIDGGSTMFELAKLVADKNVTIVSNNVLLKQLNLKSFVLLKGELNNQAMINLSDETFLALDKFKFDKAFFGFSSFKKNKFFTSSEIEAKFKRKVIDNAVESFAVGDIEKSFKGDEFAFANEKEVSLI